MTRSDWERRRRSERGRPSNGRGPRRHCASLSQLARVQQIGDVGGIDMDVARGLVFRRSPECLRLHGPPPDRIDEIHEGWLARLHPADRERGQHPAERAGGLGRVYESEYRIVRPSDGHARWIDVGADIERDASGAAVRRVGAHIDVTDQKPIE